MPAELGGSDAPREMLDEDPELESSVLGRTTGSDEPATEGGIDLSAGDQADATTDGGSEPPRRARSPTRRTSAPRPASPTPTTLPSQAFAEAAARDGIALERRAFDWLCEQGHVGLERVAKARRDPAIVAPVIAALEVLAAIYARLKGDVSVLHAARENLFLPVDLVHPPTGTVIAVDGREHFTSFRLDGARALSGGRGVGFDVEEHRELCRTLPAQTDAARRAGSPRRASASAACRASAPTTTRCWTSRSRRWATRRSCGSRRSTATARPPTRATAPRCCRSPVIAPTVAVVCDELRIEGVTKRPRRSCLPVLRRQRGPGVVGLSRNSSDRTQHTRRC